MPDSEDIRQVLRVVYASFSLQSQYQILVKGI